MPRSSEPRRLVAEIFARAERGATSAEIAEADVAAETLAALEDGTVRPSELTDAAVAKLVRRFGASRVVAAGVDGEVLRRGEGDLPQRDAAPSVPKQAPVAAPEGFPRSGWMLVAAAVLLAVFVAWPNEPERQLIDGGRTIVIHGDGSVDGLDGLPSDLQRVVATTVATGVPEIPEELHRLLPSSGTLMGGERPQQEVPVSPLGIVAEVQPLFEWQGTLDGREFAVYVFDASGRELLRSAWQQARQWRPDAPLPRGAVLSWQIIARQGRDELVFPAPPSPEARFSVLDAALAARLDEARRESQGSHLVMGILYARAGLVREARRELNQLAAQNPNATLPPALLGALPATP